MRKSDRTTDTILEMIESSPETLTNQYLRTFSGDMDKDGALIRRSNLKRYLTERSDVDILLVSQAPGHLGARWSGVPLTDTQMIAEGLLGVGYRHTAIRSEPTSQTVAEGLGSDANRIHLWSTVPWHPAGKTHDSNRKPTQLEQDAGSLILSALIDGRDFRHYLSLGEVASAALAGLGLSSTEIPHPYYDGEAACIDRLRRVLGDIDDFRR